MVLSRKSVDGLYIFRLERLEFIPIAAVVAHCIPFPSYAVSRSGPSSVPRSSEDGLRRSRYHKGVEIGAAGTAWWSNSPVRTNGILYDGEQDTTTTMV